MFMWPQPRHWPDTTKPASSEQQSWRFCHYANSEPGPVFRGQAKPDVVKVERTGMGIGEVAPHIKTIEVGHRVLAY
jgi:hypothetical protein